ncbi:MAG: hypothetical protein MMC23_009193, partial [Stictis urceolatum]|nr:hypothetical protein [Stictis urceolata]
MHVLAFALEGRAIELETTVDAGWVLGSRADLPEQNFQSTTSRAQLPEHSLQSTKLPKEQIPEHTLTSVYN